LLNIVEARSRPVREKSRSGGDVPWWHFWRVRAELFAAIAPLKRCLVNSQVSKHLVFSFQPTDQVFGHTLYVYPLEHTSSFVTLQSRVHNAWANLLSSTLEDRAGTSRIRYSASDSFDTYPFPKPEPRTVVPALEDIGQRL